MWLYKWTRDIGPFFATGLGVQLAAWQFICSKSPVPRFVCDLTDDVRTWVSIHNDGDGPLVISHFDIGGEKDLRSFLQTKHISDETLKKFKFRAKWPPTSIAKQRGESLMERRGEKNLELIEIGEINSALSCVNVNLSYRSGFGWWQTHWKDQFPPWLRETFLKK